jgi:hypothetical protein
MKPFEIYVTIKNKNGGISLNDKQRHKFLLDHSYTHLLRKCDGEEILYSRDVIELALKHKSRQNLRNVSTYEEYCVIHPEIVLKELADKEIDKLLESTSAPARSLSLLESRIAILYSKYETIPTRIRVTQRQIAEMQGTLPQYLPSSGTVVFWSSFGTIQLVWNTNEEPLWGGLK